MTRTTRVVLCALAHVATATLALLVLSSVGVSVLLLGVGYCAAVVLTIFNVVMDVLDAQLEARTGHELEHEELW